MKLRAALMLLLLLGSAVLIPVTHARFTSVSKQVEVYETVLEGDPAAAEGLLLSLRPSMAGRLVWDVRHTVGGGTETEVFFRHREADPGYWGYTNYFATHDRFGFPIYSDEDALWYETSLNGVLLNKYVADIFAGDYGEQYLAEVGKDVASRTEPGKRYTERVRLADYYECYPLRDENGYYFGISEKNLVQWQAVQDFFRIPTPEEQFITVTIEKSRENQIISMEYHSEVDDPLFTVEVLRLAEDYAYLFLCQRTGAVLDLSHISGGYGIFRVSLVPQQYHSRSRMPDFTRLETVFLLPEDAAVEWYAESFDMTKLYLITREPEGRVFRQIDLAGMTQMQSFPLEEKGPVASIDRHFVYEDGVLLFLSETEFLYLAADDEGLLSVAQRGDCATEWEGAVNYPTVAWDGTRLALLYQDTMTCSALYRGPEPYLDAEGNWHYESFCRVVLMVFTGDQRRYMSCFDNSLDRDTQQWPRVELMDQSTEYSESYVPPYRAEWR